MNTAPRHYLPVGLGITVVTAAVWWGLMILGPPAQERERRMDDKRVKDLALIGGAADLYQSRRGALPRSLGELATEAGTLTTHDPDTKQPYEYRIVDSERYELCAQFQQASADRGSAAGHFWNHGAGRVCFVLTAQKIWR